MAVGSTAGPASLGLEIMILVGAAGRQRRKPPASLGFVKADCKETYSQENMIQHNDTPDNLNISLLLLSRSETASSN